jgi:hypothetical protein
MVIKIELYEPAMCCPTGVCGPTVDPALLTITALAKEVNTSQVARIYRRNLSQNPQAFARCEIVKDKIAQVGMESLPITLVDGEFYQQGKYPTAEQIQAITGLTLAKVKQ